MQLVIVHKALGLLTAGQLVSWYENCLHDHVRFIFSFLTLITLDPHVQAK